MKPTVLTIGTRGEVQPCIAIGSGLQAAGRLFIQAVTDQEMRNRAAALGERIRAEDGIAKAVEVIERYFNIQ